MIQKYSAFLLLSLCWIGLFAGCATQPLVVPEGKFQDNALTANTYAYKNQDALRLSERIRQDLAAISPANDLGYDITAVYRTYSALNRNAIPTSDLLELKFTMQHWRLFLKAHYDKRLMDSQSAAEAVNLLRQMSSLSVYIEETFLDRIGRHLTTLSPDIFKEHRELGEAFTKLAVLQGDPEITDRLVEMFGLKSFYQPGLSLDGPRKKVDIVPSFGTDWSFDKWSKIPELSQYERTDGKVRYRGLTLEPGDIFLVNLRNPTEFIFTAVTQEDNYTLHMAMYVEIEKNGRVFPAVYEIHEKGLRLVPLNVFFLPRFISYTEVYRFKNRPAGWAALLNTATQRVLREPHGFNLHADETKSRYNRFLTCTTAITYLLGETKQSYPVAAGLISSTTQKNLVQLGVFIDRILTPTDFYRYPDLEFVGCVDNGFFTDHITIECIRVKFNEYLSTYTVKPGGLSYTIAKSAIELNRKRIFILEPFLRSSFGFTKDNQPDGPPALMSFYLMADEEAHNVFIRLHPVLEKELASYNAQTSFSIHSFIANPKIEYCTELAMKNIREFYEMPASETPK
jgi:hypothetical protein